MDETQKSPQAETFDPTRIERPDRALLTYYTIIAALTVIGFPFVFLPYYFKYRTLRYQFDDRGVSASWGLLFHREVYLTYRRIQDIHVTRNLIHRWLGLADVAVQTASGSSGAELTIEGLRNPEALRDFLYSQMRGVSDEDGEGKEEETIAPTAPSTTEVRSPDAVAAKSAESDELTQLLREIRDGLRDLRAAMETSA